MASYRRANNKISLRIGRRFAAANADVKGREGLLVSCQSWNHRHKVGGVQVHFSG